MAGSGEMVSSPTPISMREGIRRTGTNTVPNSWARSGSALLVASLNRIFVPISSDHSPCGVFRSRAASSGGKETLDSKDEGSATPSRLSANSFHSDWDFPTASLMNVQVRQSRAQHIQSSTAA